MVFVLLFLPECCRSSEEVKKKTRKGETLWGAAKKKKQNKGEK